jgi:hypothetical protein
MFEEYLELSPRLIGNGGYCVEVEVSFKKRSFSFVVLHGLQEGRSPLSQSKPSTGSPKLLDRTLSILIIGARLLVPPPLLRPPSVA